MLSRLLLIAAFLISAAPPPVVNADVPYCFAIKNPPLDKPHRHVNGFAPLSPLV